MELLIIILISAVAFLGFASLLFFLSVMQIDKARVRVIADARDLLDYISDKYDVRDTYSFNCKYMRKLAVSTGWRRDG